MTPISSIRKLKEMSLQNVTSPKEKALGTCSPGTALRSFFRAAAPPITHKPSPKHASGLNGWKRNSRAVPKTVAGAQRTPWKSRVKKKLTYSRPAATEAAAVTPSQAWCLLWSQCSSLHRSYSSSFLSRRVAFLGFINREHTWGLCLLGSGHPSSQACQQSNR